MHIDNIVSNTWNYVTHTIQDAFVVKFLVGAFATIAGGIYSENVLLVQFMVVLYGFDFLLGLARAKQNHDFESAKFFKGAMKLGVYGMLLYVAHAVDAVFPTNGSIIKIMFAFIIITDASSIIENLHQLGFEVPYFLVKYLGVAKDRLDDQVAKMLEIKETEINPEPMPTEK